LALRKFLLTLWLTVLILLLVLSPLLYLSETVYAQREKGPVSEYLDIYFFDGIDAACGALINQQIDIVDRWLPPDIIQELQSLPYIILDPCKGGSPPCVYLKRCMPDLGQHSENWCWVAALANSLYWYSTHGYPNLVPLAWTEIDPDSTNPNMNGITGAKWFCPCGNGYMTLLKEIAKATPDNTDNDGDGELNEDPVDGIDNDLDGLTDEDPPHKVFCQPANNEEYEEMLDKYLKTHEPSLEWKVIHSPSLDDCVTQLSRCEDVILVLDTGVTLHDVTLVGYNLKKNPPEIYISDPWTPGSPDHNNNPTCCWLRYDRCQVINSAPLTINYSGIATPVHKMYYISPKERQKAHGNLIAGVVNDVLQGVDNYWTFLKAYRVDDPMEPIRYGICQIPSALNPIYSYSYPYNPPYGPTEWLVLDKIHDTLLKENPYNPSILQPWIAQDWEVGTWIDVESGLEKTEIKIYIRKDVGIAEPITGNYVRNFDAHDLAFTIWYTYAFENGSHWDSVEGVHHTEILDDYTIKIYFDELDEGFQWKIGEGLPLLVRDELLPKLCGVTSESWIQEGRSEHKLTEEVVEVVEATLNGEPLVEGVDYIIRAGYDVYCHNVFVPLRDLTGFLTITYWYPDKPADGYYLAGLDWSEVMYSVGPYYPVDIVPGTGGHVFLRANPYFFLETPPLGEIDWRWWWGTPGGIPGPEIPGRDSGYFEVDILDVVSVCTAYCSQGTAVPDPDWASRADIDKFDVGHVGIFDVVTVCAQYGYKFGQPP